MARIPVALWFHKSNPAAPQVVLIGEGDNVPQALLDAANSALGADAPENNRIAMHNPKVALFGHGVMSELSLLTGVNRTSRLRPTTSEFDPLRTSAIRGPTELERCAGRYHTNRRR
jgi:hypothetical protein